jgi:hypothetical protein
VRIWGRVALGGIAALTSSLALGGPAGATPSHPGELTDTCPEVLTGAPTGGVEKVTDPPDGSEVHRGTLVVVTLRWDRDIFAGSVLHKALDCVTVDGTPAEALGIQERDTANDGIFETRFVVPGDLADGTRLCDRGFVSGPGPENTFERQKSNDVCLTVSGDVPTMPAPAGPTTPDTAPPAPASAAPDLALAPPLDRSVAAPGNGANPIPPVVDANRAGRGTPGAPVGPDVDVLGEQRNVLPRTGSTIGGSLRLALLTLLLGGSCLLASRLRVHRKPVM